MADRRVLLDLLNRYNNFYLYEESVILEAAGRLKANFPGAQFLYSMKCNPAGRVLDTVFSQGFGTDAASLGEVIAAGEHGVPAGLIYFSAPGRTEIGVRINPDFTFAADSGVPGKFGVDEEALWNADLTGVKLVGIHVHSKSQELSAAVLAHYYENMFALIGRVQEHLGVTLRFANFGSGLGIPFAPGEEPLDVEALGKRFQAMLAECRAAYPGLQILIETGRYVSGKSGTYVAKVLDKKVSHGKTFLILNGTLNAFARPAVAQMVRGFTDHPFPYEPIFTHVDASALLPLTDNQDTEVVTLAGNLCTSADIIAKDVSLPRMEIGDGLALDNAGCYAAVMTPMQFAFMTQPAQLFLTQDGRVLKA